MNKLPPRQHPPEADYEVGYGKPPKAHQFGARAQPKRHRRKPRIDLLKLLNEPVKIASGGMTRTVHPHEAKILALGKRALGGKLRAAKAFLGECKKAGLLERSPGKRIGGVATCPTGIPDEVLNYLLHELGGPPWDDELIEQIPPGYETATAAINAVNQPKGVGCNNG